MSRSSIPPQVLVARICYGKMASRHVRCWHTPTYRDVCHLAAFGGEADISQPLRRVRKVLESTY
jgi:hypothetical protein